MIENFITAATTPLDGKGSEVVGSAQRNNVAAANVSAGSFNDDFWRNIEGGRAALETRGKDSHDFLQTPAQSFSAGGLRTPSLRQASQAVLQTSARLAENSLSKGLQVPGMDATGVDRNSGASDTTNIQLIGDHLPSVRSEGAEGGPSSSSEVGAESSTGTSSADEVNPSLSSFVDRPNFAVTAKVQSGEWANIPQVNPDNDVRLNKDASQPVRKSPEKSLKHTLQGLVADPSGSFSSGPSNLAGDTRLPTWQDIPAPPQGGIILPVAIGTNIVDPAVQPPGQAGSNQAYTPQALASAPDGTNNRSFASAGSGDIPLFSAPTAEDARTSITPAGHTPNSDPENLPTGVNRGINAAEGLPVNILQNAGAESNRPQKGQQEGTELSSVDLARPVNPLEIKEVRTSGSKKDLFQAGPGISKSALLSAIDGNVKLRTKDISSEQSALRTASIIPSQPPSHTQLGSQTALAESKNSSFLSVEEGETPPTQIGLHPSTKESSRKGPTDLTATVSLGEGAGANSSFSPAAAAASPISGLLDRKENSLGTAPALGASLNAEVINLLPVSTTHPLMANEGRASLVARATEHAGLVDPAPEGRTVNLDRSEPTVAGASTKLLEVGMASGSNGWIKVRAESDSGGAISASVTANTGTAVEALHKDLPALTAYLKEQAVTVNSLVVHRTDPGGSIQDAVTTSQQDHFGRSEGNERRQGEPDRDVQGGPARMQNESDYLPIEYVPSSSIESTVRRSNGWFDAIA